MTISMLFRLDQLFPASVVRVRFTKFVYFSVFTMIPNQIVGHPSEL